MAKKKKSKQQQAKQKPKSEIREQNSQIDWLKKHPNWVAFGIFTLIIFVFFKDALFNGMIYLVPDFQAHTALSKPLQQNSGINVQWMPYIFGGMPSFASLTYTPSFAYFPYFLLELVKSIITLPPLFAHIIHYPFAGLGVYLILRDREVDFLPAMFGGMAFMLMPHLISMEVFGHGSKLMTTVYMPLAFWAVNRLLHRGGWLYLGLSALILGLQFQRGHVQIVYYTWMLLGAYMIYFMIQKIRAQENKTIPPLVGKVAAVLVLALGMAAVQYLSIYEYMPYSIRGAASALAETAGDTGVGIDYATQWSFSFGEMLTFIIPSLYGYGGATYWGTMPFTDYPHYMGILVFLLGIFALVYRRQQTSIFHAVVIVLALLISFGKNFPPVYKLFYNFMPFFNKFRVPVMILVIVQMCFAVLSGMGLQRLFELVKQRSEKSSDSKLPGRVLIAAGAIIALVLIMSIAESGFFSFMKGLYPDRYAANVQSQIDQQRFDMLMTDWWIVSIFSAAALSLFYLAMRKKISAPVFGVAILAITLVDIWRVDAKINNPEPNTTLENYLKPDQLANFLKKDESIYRIFPLNIPFIGLNLFGENRWAAHGVESIGGYSANKPRVYQDILEASDIANQYIQKYYTVGLQNGQRTLQQIPDDRIDPGQRKVHQNLLNLLNAKYLVSPYPIPEPAIENVGQATFVVGNQQVPLGIFENKDVLPRVYLVGNYKKFDNPKTALHELVSPDFNPRSEVILYKEPLHKPSPDSTAMSELVEYGLHEIKIRTNAEQPQILVLSDTWYPAGWHVLVDGQDAETLQANHAFRAVSLPAGGHEIVFYFASRGFRVGMWLTILSTLVVAGMLVVGVWRAKT